VVSFVGSDVGGGNVADITDLIWPAVQSGDVALLFWIMINTATPVNPTGFTLNQTIDSTTGAGRMRFQHRVCDGSESGALTLSAGAINRQSACLVVYRGCHATSPIDTWAVRDETVTGTTHANPQVTTGFGDCAVVAAIGERSGTGTNAWTAPSGYTKRADSAALAVGAGGTICASADDGLAISRAAGTAVTPPVWTSGNAFSTNQVLTWTVSLRQPDPLSRPLFAMAAAAHRAANW
jgi:hypothetical protein